MTISWPVMYREAGAARKRARPLMSSGCPTRCIGMSRAIAACRSGSVGVAPADVGDEEPGGDRVGGDAVGGELERGRVHEVAGARLRRHVRGADGGLHLGRRQRGGDDDPAEPPRAHVTAAARAVAKMPLRLMSMTRFQRSSV